MKKVSFKVAEAIATPYMRSTVSEEIGKEDTKYSKVYVHEYGEIYTYYTRYMRGDGEGHTWGWSDFCFDFEKPFPTYLELWTWLAEVKKIAINVQLLTTPFTTWWFSIENIDTSHIDIKVCHNPEDAIEIAINYLVDNDLIK